jgi:hypothetical protein
MLIETRPAQKPESRTGPVRTPKSRTGPVEIPGSRTGPIAINATQGKPNRSTGGIQKTPNVRDLKGTVWSGAPLAGITGTGNCPTKEKSPGKDETAQHKQSTEYSHNRGQRGSSENQSIIIGPKASSVKRPEKQSWLRAQGPTNKQTKDRPTAQQNPQREPPFPPPAHPCKLDRPD